MQIYEEPQGVNTPLTYSAECGYYGATKLLLENGADPNYQELDMNKNGLLALRFYNNDKAAETLQLLLDYGTDLDIRTNVQAGKCLKILKMIMEKLKKMYQIMMI